MPKPCTELKVEVESTVRQVSTSCESWNVRLCITKALQCLPYSPQGQHSRQQRWPDLQLVAGPQMCVRKYVELSGSEANIRVAAVALML